MVCGHPYVVGSIGNVTDEPADLGAGPTFARRGSLDRASDAFARQIRVDDDRPRRSRDPKVREELTRVSELLCATNRIGSVRWRLGRYALACQYTQLQRDMP